MRNPFYEFDLLIRCYRDSLELGGDKFKLDLQSIAQPTAKFIIDICKDWDDAIRTKGLLSDFAQTECALKDFLACYEQQEIFSGSVLYEDIRSFLQTCETEKSNDIKKAEAQAKVVKDFLVLQNCRTHLQDAAVE